MTDVMPAVSFQPTLILPTRLSDEHGVDLGNAEAFHLMVALGANDDVGATIGNVMIGDIVIIESASGICSFKEANMNAVKAIVGLVGTITGQGIGALINAALTTETLGVGTPAAAAATETFVTAWNTSLTAMLDAFPASAINHAQRNAFGQDPGSGDYAKDEGGLIVCMPECRGAVYATDNYSFDGDAKKHGRKYDYYAKDAKKKNLFFPCPVSGGRMRAQATQPGMVNILAWDSNFRDNAGVYKVSVVIIRGDRPPGASPEELVNKLMAMAPNVK